MPRKQAFRNTASDVLNHHHICNKYVSNLQVYPLGAGLGLIYLPSIVCVSFYFDSKRSIATGITVAGSGAGTFALPPLCVYFIKGWFSS